MIPCSESKRAGEDTGGTDFWQRLQADFPDLRFTFGRKFAFRPPKTIVMEPENGRFWRLLLFHEVGHAVLGHRDFGTDVERLKMEVAAWEKARELAEIYAVEFDEGMMEAELDTYRDWLHRKSRCPKCGLTRYQASGGEYHCPRCENIA